MDNPIVSTLRTLNNTRNNFAQWYGTNVDSNSLVEFLNRPPDAQVGIFLAFLGSQNIGVDVKITPDVNGYNLRILDSVKFIHIQNDLPDWVKWFCVDGDYYITMKNNLEGKTLGLYYQAIMYAFNIINQFQFK